MEKTSNKEKETKKVVKAKTASKKNNTKNTKQVKESYIKGVKKEMSLVKWPTWKEVIKNTIATIVLCVIVCGFFILLNLLLSFIKGLV